jgi:hypothetical protein
MIVYSKEIPQSTERVGRVMRVNYGVWELTEEEILALWLEEIKDKESEQETPDDWFREEHRYGYYSTDVLIGRWNYNGVVEAMIREKYSQNEMEAITNNMAAINALFMQTLVTEGIVGAIQYLRDSYDKDNAEIFKEMQEWRHMAKKEAKSIFYK